MALQGRSPLVVLSALAILTVIVWWLSVTRPSPITSTTLPTTCSLTLAQQVTQADLILSGRVVVIIPDAPGQARVIIQPDHVYRGAVSSPTLTIMAVDDLTEPGSASSILHLTSHDPPYLFYLRQIGVELYTTSRCQGTRLLGREPSSVETALFSSAETR